MWSWNELCANEANDQHAYRSKMKWKKKSIKQKILMLYWVFVCRNKGRLNGKKEKQRAKANTQDIGSVLQQHLSQINLLMHIICVKIAFFSSFLHRSQETASRVVASNQMEGKGFKNRLKYYLLVKMCSLYLSFVIAHVLKCGGESSQTTSYVHQN